MKTVNMIFFFFLFSFPMFLHAQTVSIGTVAACRNQEVLVPVNAQNLINAGAISLYIGFDSTKMTFRSIENIDAQLSGYMSNLLNNPPRIGFAWSSATTPASFPSGKLFDLKFTFFGNQGSVQFRPECEISNANVPPENITVTWVSGAVDPGDPVIVKNPGDTTVVAGRNAIFGVTSTHTANYLWKESQDNGLTWVPLQDGGNYSGTHSQTLTIAQVPSSMNNHKFYCYLENGACSAASGTAMLRVDSVSGTDDIQKETEPELFNYPNPFISGTRVEYFLPRPGTVHIFISDCTGKILTDLVNGPRERGNYKTDFHVNGLSPGFYYCIMNFSGSDSKKILYRKMIILPFE
jgi:hypothetical protein